MRNEKILELNSSTVNLLMESSQWRFCAWVLSVQEAWFSSLVSC